jgi:hypothetical protein
MVGDVMAGLFKLEYIFIGQAVVDGVPADQFKLE